MYSNLTKGGAFPLVARVSSKPRCTKQFFTSKHQAFPLGLTPKPSLNLSSVHFSTLSSSSASHSYEVFVFTRTSWGPTRSVVSASSGFRFRSAVHCYCCFVLRGRSFSSLYPRRVGEGGGVVKRGGKPVAWLSSKRVKEARGVGKVGSVKTGRSSWEESAEKLGKLCGGSSWEESSETLGKGRVVNAGSSVQEYSGRRLGNLLARKDSKFSLQEASDRSIGFKESRKRVVDVVDEDEEEGEEEEVDAVDSPKWDRKGRRLPGIMGKSLRLEFQRGNKRENWGGRVGREATESTVPKMVGEGVYGVGPVLAALSAKRREFYGLYVQGGLDLSNNTRKKKDKKGFEKVLRMAEKIGLNIKEVSKHDLNMVVDNRPHQGLVLDASPLEMVKITELDTVSPEEDQGSLWVALDEVTDPQNLGAIVRSAYFFGVSGVVLCAKNSAPLSGVVSKASAGSLELMELRYCKNMMQFLVASAENGWRVLGGSVASKAIPLNDILPGEPTILVLGSEGTGLRPLVERSCTELVRIPGNIPVDRTVGGTDDVENEETNTEYSSKEFGSFLAVESLNVSVAAGVLLHHLIGNNRIDNCSIGDH